MQDQSTRQIIIHRILFGKDNHFKTKDVIAILDECIHNKQRPSMIHTDSGKQFLSKEYVEFLERQGIEHSLGHATRNEERYRMHNQVHERFHRTLKGEIRKIMQDHFSLPHKPRELTRMIQLEDDEVASIVNQAVNNFNNLRSQSKAAFGGSPNIMEDALALFEKSKPVTELLGGTGTKKGEEIALLKGKAIKEYAGDWVAFFVEWRQQSEERHQEALKLAIERHQEALKQGVGNKEPVIQVVVKHKEIIAQQNKELQQQLALVTEKVGALKEEMLRKAQLERLDKERKDRRTGRQRRPSRAAATYLEYQEALNSVNSITKEPFVAARKRVCLLFLYIAGVRVSNCFKYTVFHLQQMVDGNTFTITAIKSKETKHLSVTINKVVHALILERKDHIETICQGKQEILLVITPKGKKEPLFA